MNVDIIGFDDSVCSDIGIVLKRCSGLDGGVVYNMSKKHSPGFDIDIKYRDMFYIIYKVVKDEYDTVYDMDTLYDGSIRYLDVVKSFLDLLCCRFGFDGCDVCVEK